MRGVVVALLVVLGIVLLPPRAVAAKVPMLIAYDAAVRSTAVRVEAAPSLRSGVRECAYDDGHDGYDDASNSPVIRGAGADHASDRAIKLAHRREVHGDGAIYDPLTARTATEEE